MGPLLNAIRTARFRLWVLATTARLRRLGGALVLDVAATPRLSGLPRVEIDGRPGTVTLRIGRDVKIGRDVVLDLADGRDGIVELADQVTLQHRVRLQPWGGRIAIGTGTQLRDNVELKSTGELTVGAWTVLSRNATLHCHERIALGDHIALAERVTVIDSDHTIDGSDTPILDQPVRSAPIVIGDSCLVGTNAVVLRGTTIGPRCMVGANSVVNGGDFPAGHLVAGVPARALRPLGAVTA